MTSGHRPWASFGVEGLVLSRFLFSVKRCATVKWFAEQQLAFQETESVNSECSKFQKKEEKLSLILMAVHLQSLHRAMRPRIVPRLALAERFYSGATEMREC
jgi:hypothetical protein